MKKKLNIAIIGSRGYPYVYSGYETLVKELSERLVKKGNKVRVYCHRSLFKNRPKYLNDIELIYTPSIETKILSQFINSFFSFIHACFSKVDVIFVVNTANGPFGLFTKLFRKKTCINVDGLEWLRPKWKGFGSYYFIVASKLSILFFDEVVTDSYEMNKIYLEKFNKKSTVIAYGSTMVKNSKTNFLNLNNIKKNSYYLIVGRLIPDNNSLLIINGFLKSNSKKKLVIVGDVPYVDEYSNEIKSIINNRIILLGYVKDQKILSELYHNSYAYIHGHEFGGTNPTMINAIDLNCSIIALNTKFNLEMLDKQKFLLFEKNEESISNVLNEFELIDKKIKASQSNMISERFNWNSIVNQYQSLFQKLLD